MKNTIRKTGGGVLAILLAVALSSFWMSCSDGGSDSGGGSSDGGVSSTKIYLTGTSDTKVTLYVWSLSADATGDDPNKTEYCGSWPGSAVLTTKESEGISGTINIKKTLGLGLIIVDTGGAKIVGSVDVKIPASVLQTNQTLYFAVGSNDYYTSLEDIKGLKSATITTKDGNTVVAVINGYDTVDKTDITVKDKDDSDLTVTNVAKSKSNITITLSNGDIDKAPYKVTFDGKTVEANVSNDVMTQIIEEKITDTTLAATDFGVTITGTKASFKMFAPTASDVKLLLFQDAASCGVKGNDIGYDKWKTQPTAVADENIKQMTKADDGTWAISNVDFGSNKYYKYRITNGAKTYDIADIWSKACAPDGVASQIVDINADASAKPAGSSKTYGTKEGYTNPFTGSSYADAVIYEMHIWDWNENTAASDTTNKATFEGFASDANIAHLKDLGITHVQILPMYEYATTRADPRYNWGYDPYHYNVPESRYSTADDGAGIVKSMRTMIEKLHQADIAVIMDVVYNHTSGTGEYSLYDMTVPKYFYRLMPDGAYSNGSGCGNETATNHAMYKKYVIDSLKHWMLDYHINGFRFDLMGIHEKEFMKDAYDELAKIDAKVMVYGEPWTGGTALAENPSTVAQTSGTNGVAAFDDGIRDAIKGSVFDRIVGGQVQGDGGKHTLDGSSKGGYNDNGIINGLTKGGERNKESNLALSIRYVACHDNNTLFDKLCLSNSKRTTDTSHAHHIGDMMSEIDETTNTALKTRREAAGYASAIDYIKAEDTLAGAYMILAQGTPFLYGGQDFCRTKLGNDNSYGGESGVTLANYHAENKIDLARKEVGDGKFGDVYKVYKGLLKLRKDNASDFRALTTGVTAEQFKSGTTKVAGTTVYTTPNFKVIYNATDSALTLASSDTTDYTKVIDVTSGTPTDGTTLPTTVKAKSFVILKK